MRPSDAVHEGRHQSLVELRAARILEPCQGFLDEQRLAVRPGGRHRRERITDSGIRAPRDGIAGQSVQVALPVPTLVVVADAGADLVEVGQVTDDEVAERDVLLHRLVLALGEGTGLAQDLVGDADLADVVEATGPVQHRADLIVETELRAQETGVAGNVLRIPARVVVLRVDGDDQALEDVPPDGLIERHDTGLGDADAVTAARLGLVERPRRAGGASSPTRRDREGADRR